MNIKIDATIHNHIDPAVEHRLAAIEKVLDILLKKADKIMATLDDTLALVTAESTKLDSIQALITGLKQQVADALAGVTLPPAAQAKLDAVFAGMTTNAGKIDTALEANVP